MISCPLPTGATMCYRLDPYSLDIVANSKPKSMHDVVEPTILFFHKKNSKTSSPASATTNASPSSCSWRREQKYAIAPNPTPAIKNNTDSYQPVSPASSSPALRGKHARQLTNGSAESSCSSPSPASSFDPAKATSIRYCTVNTLTSSCITLAAPFRVVAGDPVVFQASNGGEHAGTVTHVFGADYVPPPPASVDAAASAVPSPTRRLIRKVRSVDHANQKENIAFSETTVRPVLNTILEPIQKCLATKAPPLVLLSVEWQLDRSALIVSLQVDDGAFFCVSSSHLQEVLQSIYNALVAHFRCEIQILTSSSSPPAATTATIPRTGTKVTAFSSSHTSSSSPSSFYHSAHSSPALSDCEGEGTSSVGEAPCSCDFYC